MVRTVLTLWGVVTLTFVLGRLQGDPVKLLLPLTAPAEDFENMRTSLGLDQPIPVQYVTYLGNVLRGELGDSIASRRPVTDIILERIPATLELGLPAFLLSVFLSIPLGILAALKRNSIIDRAIMTLSLVGHSLPAFIIGILLILIFSVNFHWFPAFGRDNLTNLVLPTIALTIYPLTILIRLTRSSMLEVLNEVYIRTAYAKGLSPRRVIFVHALRNALIPVITVIGPTNCWHYQWCGNHRNCIFLAWNRMACRPIYRQPRLSNYSGDRAAIRFCFFFCEPGGRCALCRHRPPYP